MPRLIFCVFCMTAQAIASGAEHVSSAVSRGVPVTPDSIVLGVFEGRTPCGRVAVEFTGFPATNCEKIKWQLTLFADAGTGAPAGYLYRGTRTSRRGTWSVARGMAGAPDAVVYRLDYDGSGVLSLLRVDDNVLLILDRDQTVAVGDASWSYTLSRTDRSTSHR